MAGRAAFAMPGAWAQGRIISPRDNAINFSFIVYVESRRGSQRCLIPAGELFKESIGYLFSFGYGGNTP